MDNSKKPHKENPRKNANFLSVLLLTWIWPILYKGSNKGLTKEDLTKTLKIDESERLGNELEEEWAKELKKSRQNGNEARLRNALFRAYYKPFTFNGVVIYLQILTRTCSPMILAQLLRRYNSIDLTIYAGNVTTPEASGTFAEDINNYLEYMWNDKICLTSLLVLISFVAVTAYHHQELQQKLLGARMRIACCSMIYRKTLKLSKKTSDEITVGYVVNLLSNDVSRLDFAFCVSHYIWMTPVHSIVLCCIIYKEIGPAAFVGVFALLLQAIPIQSLLSRTQAKLRLKVAVRTDKRVGIMNELINGIKVIKMYAWEKPFEAVVAEARKLEIKQIRFASYIRSVGQSTTVFTERSTLFFTILTMLYLNINISADIVFSLAQYYNLLQFMSAVGYSLALSMAAEGFVSITRIEQFLKLDEHDPTKNGFVLLKDTSVKPQQSVIELNKVVASWTDSEHKTLNNVSFTTFPGKLCAIIGSVGSGKSSLLQVILGELPIKTGNIIVKGSISYGSQDPWLFSGTVKSNILFGQAFNKKRYHEVIKCCALTTDLKQLPYGDKTFVGEKGASLSGGQKARISLARAVYKVADIYLLDDPLSAVDAHVGRYLYNEVIGPQGFLARSNAARILVTHQVHYLNESDWIIVIKDGNILQQGTHEEHLNSCLDFTSLQLHKTSEKRETIEKLIENIPETSLIETEKGYALIPRSDSVSTDDSIYKSVHSLYETPEIIEEKKAEGSVSLKVWTRYFTDGGSLFYIFYVLLVFVFSQIVTSFCDYFVNIWTQQEFLRMNNLPTAYSTDECLYIYAALVFGVIFFVFLRCYTFIFVCMRASKTLHKKMFEAIVHAPMRFFDTNPSGQILNRFSRDMGNIDELFPRSFLSTLQIIFIILGILSIVIVINPKLLLVLCGAMILYIIGVTIYLRAAQDLKRLEGITRSPVFGHLSATLSGITTIRVTEAQQKLSKEFDELQNVHTNAWQLIHASNSTFGLWLDFISCTFVGFVAFSFILFENNTTAGNVGLALSQSLILTGMVQFGIRQTTDSMQLMTCVERILEYCDIKPELSSKNKPSEKWPEKGTIEFDEMSYSYDVNLPSVLKNITVRISSGWKVGIVGRTGAGKSSLISALLRLGHVDGQITIDNIDTSEVTLESLRQNIAIIPQDPILFSATIRYNLDPFGLYTDEQLWKVLDEVELKSKIKQLDYLVTESGSNLSVGERQLMCLARAILRNNKIIVLDEATANVDPQTDALIQKTIRVKLENCTVLTIAHRLHTVMDYDRILVLDNGSVKEFDTAYNLLQFKTGYLSNMVEATGENESATLRKIASLAYTNLT